MVQVSDLTGLALRDLWQEAKGEDEWWGDVKGRTIQLSTLVDDFARGSPAIEVPLSMVGSG